MKLFLVISHILCLIIHIQTKPVNQKSNGKAKTEIVKLGIENSKNLLENDEIYTYENSTVAPKYEIVPFEIAVKRFEIDELNRMEYIKIWLNREMIAVYESHKQAGQTKSLDAEQSFSQQPTFIDLYLKFIQIHSQYSNTHEIEKALNNFFKCESFYLNLLAKLRISLFIEKFMEMGDLNRENLGFTQNEMNLYLEDYDLDELYYYRDKIYQVYLENLEADGADLDPKTELAEPETDENTIASTTSTTPVKVITDPSLSEKLEKIRKKSEAIVEEEPISKTAAQSDRHKVDTHNENYQEEANEYIYINNYTDYATEYSNDSAESINPVSIQILPKRGLVSFEEAFKKFKKMNPREEDFQDYEPDQLYEDTSVTSSDSNIDSESSSLDYAYAPENLKNNDEIEYDPRKHQDLIPATLPKFEIVSDNESDSDATVAIMQEQVQPSKSEIKVENIQVKEITNLESQTDSDLQDLEPEPQAKDQNENKIHIEGSQEQDQEKFEIVEYADGYKIEPSNSRSDQQDRDNSEIIYSQTDDEHENGNDRYAYEDLTYTDYLAYKNLQHDSNFDNRQIDWQVYSLIKIGSPKKGSRKKAHECPLKNAP